MTYDTVPSSMAIEQAEQISRLRAALYTTTEALREVLAETDGKVDSPLSVEIIEQASFALLEGQIAL